MTRTAFSILGFVAFCLTAGSALASTDDGTIFHARTPDDGTIFHVRAR